MSEPLDPSTALRTAIAIADAGVEMMRARIERESPTASDEEVRLAIANWLRDRPPDGVGVAGTWPRTRR
jgi:hypothetical protein